MYETFVDFINTTCMPMPRLKIYMFPIIVYQVPSPNNALYTCSIAPSLSTVNESAFETAPDKLNMIKFCFGGTKTKDTLAETCGTSVEVGGLSK